MAQSPLVKAPKGLLETFRLRYLGVNPGAFGDTVQPTVDVSDFYASDLLLNSSSAPTVGALGAGLSEALLLTAPVRLRALSVGLTIGAAAATNVWLNIGIQFPASLGFPAVNCALGGVFLAAANATALYEHGVVCPGWVLPAGVTLYSRAVGTAAGVDHSLAVVALIDNLTGSN